MQTGSLTARKGGTPIDWLLEYLHQQGLGKDKISQALNVDVSSLTPESGIVPTELYLKIFNLGAIKLNDPLIGANLAVQSHPRHFGLIGHLIMNVPSFRDGCDFMERYHRIFSADFDFQFTYFPKSARCTYIAADIQGTDSREDIDFGLGLIVRVCRECTSDKWRPLRCSFTYAAPVDATGHHEYFGENIAFDQPENIIEFENELLDLTYPRADASLLPILLQQANHLLDELESKEDLVQQIRLFITTSLGYRGVTTETVAAQLNMSVRQLHRQLTQRNTSFRKIKEETILRVAKEALLESDLSITEIALKIGYSETSAFDRAFKKLCGVTPLRYRKGVGGSSA